ncbi:ATPase with role in protein import into the ER [Ceratobasidium sp. 423]|nr:ATPase with role in protein import into the ER [Ceratobasidium sp. 423]
MISVINRGKLVYYAPEEISAIILSEMRMIAEAFIGEAVTQAVITVPAYFNDAQRQATKDAGTIAGLSVVSILNEPTTAAIAYGLDKKYTQSKIIVYDLGGGTFDVSLLSIHDGVYEVLATAGDSHLGGDDFDNRVIEHFLTEYRSKTGVDVSSIPRAMARLKREAEQAKRILSSQLAISIEIESLHNGRDFSTTLTRAKFDQLNIDLFRKTLEPIRRVLSEAHLSRADVDEIVLVGGSTRIPRVRQLLKDFFGGKEPSQGIHPNEAVVIGASLRAGALSGPDEFENVTLVDVCPFTLGIEMDGGIFAPFIQRNSPLPAKVTQIFTTSSDSQSSVLIQIFEGEGSRMETNNLLGELELVGLPPVAAGIPQIEVTFEVDWNGILKVGAQDKLTGLTQHITVLNKNRLTQKEIAQKTREAEKFAMHDRMRREWVRQLNRLQELVWGLEAELNRVEAIGGGNMMMGHNDTALADLVRKSLTYLDIEAPYAMADDLERKVQELQNLVANGTALT